MPYVFPPPSVNGLSIYGRSERVPVRRIYAIGRNYGDHAAETGLGAGDGSVPGISLKPADSILSDRPVLPYPPATRQLDPEIELVAVIGRGGRDIPRHQALGHVFGYAVGFDMIRRDVLQDCIANEHSWDLCKSFEGASPVAPVRPVESGGHPRSGRIALRVNGDLRQDGDLSRMIWDVAEIVSRLSAYSPLAPGDIVFTGTPRGPAPVVPGDRLEGTIADLPPLKLEIA